MSWNLILGWCAAWMRGRGRVPGCAGCSCFCSDPEAAVACAGQTRTRVYGGRQPRPV